MSAPTAPTYTPPPRAPQVLTLEVCPARPTLDGHETHGSRVCSWCGAYAPSPTVTLTEAQVEALVTEGAYRACQSAVLDTLHRLHNALAGMPEAQAVVDALLLDSREDD